MWIRKGVKARRVRDEGRVRRLEDLRLQRAARRDQQGQVNLAVSGGDRSGKIVADLENVSKAMATRSSSTTSPAPSCAATRSA